MHSLSRLFDLLSEDSSIPINNAERRTVHVHGAANCAGQGELFAPAETAPVDPPQGTADQRSADLWSAEDLAVLGRLFSPNGFDLSALPEAARRFFELSADAFDAFIGAWMSELPIQAETLGFGRKVLAAAGRAGLGEAARSAANRAASDRGDPDVRTVLEASYKVWHEIDRLRGFLRFSPGEDGIYTARCEPDHLVLPALSEHFTRRFGGTAWAIIDEKRRLCLRRVNREPELFGFDRHPQSSCQPPAAFAWENLWRHYHKTINNESRNNPELQRRFMPKRYWKYLPEL